MTVESEAPVSTIEGIGPATASRLRAEGIEFVLDLLRLTPLALHRIVAATHSQEQAEHWRVMASLLEIEPMTAQWAEALVAAGVETVEELSRRELSWLEQAFAQARTDGLIAEVPTTDQLGQMKRDAAVVFYSGTLTSTVLGSTGAPLSGTRVRLGTLETVTNRRGRFRLVRIPLGTQPPLLLDAPGHRPKSVEMPSLTVDPQTVAVEVYRLEAPAQGVTSSATTTPRSSELDGDVLPPMSGLPVRTEAQARDQLRRGDVFMVQKFYRREPDAMLVSRFRDYRDGELLVRTVRVPVAELPSGTEVKDHVILREDGFERIAFGPLRHQLNIALRRFEINNPAPAGQPSAAEVRARTLAKLDFLKTEGLLGHPPEDG